MKILSVLFTATMGMLSFFGFWIVALIGTLLILLPAGAFFITFFPAAANRLQTSCGLAKFAGS